MSSDEKRKRRKLRVLVITMGGDRQKKIEDLFSAESMVSTFESPTFSPGVSSRRLRNRSHFFRIANEAGLLPKKEWEAIRNASEERLCGHHCKEEFFACLNGIAVTMEERKGSQQDNELHYSVELWRKAKSINRGRSVLACLFAHLIAMKKIFSSDSASSSFDLIVEDNIRSDPQNCAKKVWGAINACNEWEKERNLNCHLRFFGWLGSTTNLEWIMQTHIPKRKYVRKDCVNENRNIDQNSDVTIVPFPRPEYLEEDLIIVDGELENSADKKNEVDRIEEKEKHEKSDTKTNKPGGNLCWGAYAYWMSNEGYKSLMETLRNDVGAILWKGKRMRNYLVKPIDKILPRQTMTKFGPSAVQISSQPAFFRAPMLTSKIHAKWDPSFCVSTEYQLQSNNLDWSNLLLTDIEREIVAQQQKSGKWLTVSELKSSSSVTRTDNGTAK